MSFSRFGHFRSSHPLRRPPPEHESGPTSHQATAVTAQDTASSAGFRPVVAVTCRSLPAADGVQGLGVRVVVRALRRGPMPLAACLSKAVTEFFWG
jgi:hypothetical protein